MCLYPALRAASTAFSTSPALACHVPVSQRIDNAKSRKNQRINLGGAPAGLYDSIRDLPKPTAGIFLAGFAELGSGSSLEVMMGDFDTYVADIVGDCRSEEEASCVRESSKRSLQCVIKVDATRRLMMQWNSRKLSRMHPNNNTRGRGLSISDML